MKLGNFPRQKYLIDGLQGRLVAVSLLYFLAILLVFAGVLFVPLAIGLNDSNVTSPAAVDAARGFLFLHTKLWTPVLLLIGLLVTHTVVVSHRIVGPLYRIRSELKKIGSGNLFVHVKLRKNDYLEKEADSVNEMVDSLRSKIRGIEQNQKRASKMLVDLQRAMIRGSADDMNLKIEGLGASLEHLERSVQEFQLPRNMGRQPGPSATEQETADRRPPVGAGT
jgi:methyl-accepting chemotaxis protein